eukprot:364182-Chlamydomonas_euryale.AAC.8
MARVVTVQRCAGERGGAPTVQLCWREGEGRCPGVFGVALPVQCCPGVRGVAPTVQRCPGKRGGWTGCAALSWEERGGTGCAA